MIDSSVPQMSPLQILEKDPLAALSLDLNMFSQADELTKEKIAKAILAAEIILMDGENSPQSKNAESVAQLTKVKEKKDLFNRMFGKWVDDYK